MAAVHAIDKPLTKREQRFVAEYLVDLNGAAAVRRMGYKGTRERRRAFKFRQQPNVAAAIEAAKHELAKRTKISQEYVVRKVRQTIERCSQGDPVRDRKGKQVFVDGPNGQLVALYAFDAKAIIAGCSLLADLLGAKKTRIEHSGVDGKPIEHADMTADRLAQTTDPNEASELYAQLSRGEQSTH